MVELGPLDLDEFRFLPPSEIRLLDGFYARDSFDADDAAELPKLVAVAEYAGTNDPFAVHAETGRVVRVGHDPPGFSMRLDSFTDLVRYAFLGLPCGYYGFPDDDVAELVEEARLRATGLR